MRVWDYIKRMFGFGAVPPKSTFPPDDRDYLYFNYEIDYQMSDVGEKFNQIEEFLKEMFGSDSVTHLTPESTPDRMERELQVNLEGENLFLSRYKEAEIVLRGPEKEINKMKERISQILGVEPRRV